MWAVPGGTEGLLHLQQFYLLCLMLVGFLSGHHQQCVRRLRGRNSQLHQVHQQQFMHILQDRILQELGCLHCLSHQLLSVPISHQLHGLRNRLLCLQLGWVSHLHQMRYWLLGLYATGHCKNCADDRYIDGSGGCTQCSYPCVSCNASAYCLSCDISYYYNGAGGCT